MGFVSQTFWSNHCYKGFFIRINGAIYQIQLGFDEGNKKKQSRNEYNIDGDSDMPIDWPKSLPTSFWNINLE